MFFVASLLFIFYPLSSIAVLFVYSMFRGSFFMLAGFSFFYDLLYTNFFWGIPKVSLFVLFTSCIAYFLWKKLSANLRRTKRVEYDF
jgi:hypothetical protein